MNGKTTKKIRQSMIIQHGEFCRNCGKLPREVSLFLNRIDRDMTNNLPENFQFLCRPCIAFRNKVDEHDDLCVKQETDEETCLSINKKKEPKFRRNVYIELLECEGRYCIEIINEQAEILQLSPVTTKRYLDKMITCLYLTTVNSRNGIAVKFLSDTAKELYRTAKHRI